MPRCRAASQVRWPVVPEERIRERDSWVRIGFFVSFSGSWGECGGVYAIQESWGGWVGVGVGVGVVIRVVHLERRRSRISYSCLV